MYLHHIYINFMLIYFSMCCSKRNISDNHFPSFKVFEAQFQWKLLNYTWPTPETYNYAIEHKLYIPGNSIISGIKIFKDKLFLTVTKFLDGVPVTLGYIPKQSFNKLNEPIRPYPNWNMHMQKDNCRTLQSVQSMEIDRNGIMWVLDGMRINNVSQCPPKIVILDINNGGKVIHAYNFSNEICLTSGGFLNDIVVDGEYAYITDSSDVDPGLIVYARNLNKAWKIRDRTMFPEMDSADFYVNGSLVNRLGAINGIALSPKSRSNSKGRRVFYCSLTGKNLYSISTSILKNETMVRIDQWRRQIGLMRRKEGQGDGLSMDNVGNLYYSLLPENGVGVFNIFQNSSPLILEGKKKNMIWPDSFGFDGNGYLYVTASNKVFSIFTGTKSYLY